MEWQAMKTGKTWSIKGTPLKGLTEGLARQLADDHNECEARCVPEPKSSVGKLQMLLEQMQDLHAKAVAVLQHVTPAVEKGKLPLPGMVDAGFLFRECMNLCDDWRKEYKARLELCNKVLCMAVIANSINDDTGGDTVRGTLASGTCDVKKTAIPPKPGTIEYTAFCDTFYVPRKVQDLGIFGLRWTAVKEMVTALAKDGRPLPDGLGREITEYHVTYRRKRT